MELKMLINFLVMYFLVGINSVYGKGLFQYKKIKIWKDSWEPLEEINMDFRSVRYEVYI